MKDNMRGVCVILFVLLGGVLIWLYTRDGQTIPGSNEALDDGYETLPQNLFDPVDTKVRHVCPKEMIRNPQYMRHRYPRYAGHNFSLLIHKGWAPLMKAAARDPQWYDNPPSQLGGYSL